MKSGSGSFFTIHMTCRRLSLEAVSDVFDATALLKEPQCGGLTEKDPADRQNPKEKLNLMSKRQAGIGL